MNLNSVQPPFRPRLGVGWAAALCLLFPWGSLAPAAELTIPQAQLSLVSDIEFAAPVAGRVVSVPVAPGDRVAAAQLLVELDQELMEAEAQAAQFDYQLAELATLNDVDFRYAEKALAVQQSELVRSQSANEEFVNTVSRTDLGRLELLVQQAELAREKSQRDLDGARLTAAQKKELARAGGIKLAQHTIAAPSDGMIVELQVEPGEWVVAGAPLGRLIQLQKLRVEAFVDGHVWDHRLVGQTLEFTLHSSAPAVSGRTERTESNTADRVSAVNTTTHDPSAAAAPETFRGVVKFVSPELNPVTGQVRLWGEVENRAEQLKPGMQGQVRVQLGSAE